MNLGVNLGLDTGGKCSRCVSVCCRCGANCSIRCLFLLLFVSHGSSNQPRHKTHAMPYLRMVDVQTARWAEARIKGCNGDKEIRWREGLKLKQDGRITKVYVHLASTRMTCEDVSVWCIWFTEQHALLQKHSGAQVVMEKADFSRNQIGNRGLSILVADVFARFVPQQLLLFGNKISDVSPLEKLLAMGTLRELHLSNNELSAYAVCQVVVVAASAKDQSGKYFYPIQGLNLCGFASRTTQLARTSTSNWLKISAKLAGRYGRQFASLTVLLGVTHHNAIVVKSTSLQSISLISEVAFSTAGEQ